MNRIGKKGLGFMQWFLMIFLFMLFFGLITGWMDTLIYGFLNLVGNLLGMV